MRGKNVTIVLQAGPSTTSSNKAFYVLNDRDGSFVIPVFSAYVRVNAGVVTKVEWDNGCFTCDSGNCKTYIPFKYNDNTQLDPESNCFDPECLTKTKDCDPKIYISFVGTDRDNNKLESAGLRLSAFRKYSLSDSYGSVMQQFSKTKTELTTEKKRILEEEPKLQENRNCSVF
eukprot:TRINITY_DN2333_c0_g1_i1.p1 TRINITY_DN2333_c0_g1~~TRINITY_DN2333_c0_g1_i1.p1  ORF type:complete len:173 (-),score=36.52 TRINITY_DN2333_c0_g1_i1:287-805(-)